MKIMALSKQVSCWFRGLVFKVVNVGFACGKASAKLQCAKVLRCVQHCPRGSCDVFSIVSVAVSLLWH